MDWIAPIIAAIVGFIGGNGLQRLNYAGRLRTSLSEEVSMLKDLPPDSPARAKLQDHVDRRLSILISVEEPFTRDERVGRFAALGYIVIGAVAIAYVAATQSDPAVILLFVVAGVGVIVGAARVLAGIYLRWIWRSAWAERGRPAPAMPPLPSLRETMTRGWKHRPSRPG